MPVPKSLSFFSTAKFAVSAVFIFNVLGVLGQESQTHTRDKCLELAGVAALACITFNIVKRRIWINVRAPLGMLTTMLSSYGSLPPPDIEQGGGRPSNQAFPQALPS